MPVLLDKHSQKEKGKVWGSTLPNTIVNMMALGYILIVMDWRYKTHGFMTQLMESGTISMSIAICSTTPRLQTVIQLALMEHG